MGRKVAQGEKRKADAKLREQQEMEEEVNRPKPPRLIRPQPKRR
jgi:hypothetical protein